jgi:hypothetical protein
VERCPPARACDEAWRSLELNIAVQRDAIANADRALQLAIRLTICSAQAERRGARFSPVSDVLPFSSGLFVFTRPSSSLDVSK